MFGITDEDMEDIIAIQFGDDIYFGMSAIDKAIELGTFTNLHPRSTFKFMSQLDLDPKWAEYATYPTLFTMQQYRERQSCLKNEEKSTEEEYVSMTPTFEGEVKGFSCQHESDGKMYFQKETPLYQEQTRCKKCAELYR